MTNDYFRQNPVQADLAAAVGAANNALTDGEQMFNDATAQAQGVLNNIVGQGLNAASQFAGAAAGGRLQQDVGAVATEVATDAQTLSNDASTILQDSAQVFTDVAGQAMGNAQNFLGNMMGGAGGAAAAPAGRRLQQDTAGDINQLATDTQGALTDAENAFNGIVAQGQGLLNNAVTTTEQAFGLGGRRLQQDVAGDATAVLGDVNEVATDLVQAGTDAFQQGVTAFQNLAGAAGGAAPAAAGRR